MTVVGDARRGHADSAAVPAGRTVPRGAVLALARVEAMRLLRHPAMLGALAGYLALWGYALVTGDAANRYPVLQDSSRYIQLPTLLLAAGTLLAADFGVLRAVRHGVEPVYEVLVVGARGRGLAHLLAVLPAALLCAGLSLARIGHLAAKPGAVGTVQWLEVATGPAVVLLAGVLGVLLARLFPTPAAASLALALLAVFTFIAAVQNTAGWRWIAVVAIEDEFAQPLPSALVGRPAGLHLLWLTGLTALLAACALLRGRPGAAPQPPRRGTRPLWAVAAVAAVVAVVAGVLQMRPLPDSVVRARADITEHPAARQQCATRGSVTYCAFPEFKGRVTEWDGVVRGVLARTPDAVADARYAVRQRIFRDGIEAHANRPLPYAAWDTDDRREGTPGAVPVGTWWSAGSAGQDAESDAVAEFSALFAYRVVTGTLPREERGTTVCGARAVLTLWLAGQATGDSGAALKDLVGRTTGGLSLLVLESASGLDFDAREREFALKLLDEPSDRLGERVKGSWRELTAAGTTTDRAAELLGVRAPAQVPAGERACA
ncbi:ABC transporter permease [Streptomyces sp. NPDC005279]|uniref:ABC transporter permease n=1 Tax=Streptomyces sp. NPDC005279 TaxID=3364712 RepID=UPI0036BB6DB2